MQLISLPTVANKYLDTMVHSFFSSLHALGQKYDIALYFIAGNSPVTWIPRLAGTRTLLNVDGLDWKREKWPTLAKKYIQLAEFLATKLPNLYLTDSLVVQNYYEERFNSKPLYIPYGSDIEHRSPGPALNKFDLKPFEYILFVGRLVPENCAHHLVEAFRELDTEFKCVIVGDATYAEDYKSKLKSLADGDSRIIFTGYVFGNGYHELGSNAYIFVKSSGMGGHTPALVEAMAFGNCVIVNDTDENLETIGEAEFSYDGKIGAASLARLLHKLLSNPDTVKYFATGKRTSRITIQSETVTNEYERLFYSVLDKPLPKRLE